MLRDLDRGNLELVIKVYHDQDDLQLDMLQEDAQREIVKRLEEGDYWAWASVTVMACWHGFRGVAHLGGCNYKDEADFRADAYFSQLVDEALEDLNSNLKKSYALLQTLEL